MRNQKFYILFVILLIFFHFSLQEVTHENKNDRNEDESLNSNNEAMTEQDQEDFRNIDEAHKELGFDNKEIITKSEFRQFIIKMLSRGQKELNEVETYFFNKVADKVVNDIGDSIPKKDIAKHLNPNFLNSILGEIGIELESEREKLNLEAKKAEKMQTGGIYKNDNVNELSDSANNNNNDDESKSEESKYNPDDYNNIDQPPKNSDLKEEIEKIRQSAENTHVPKEENDGDDIDDDHGMNDIHDEF